MAALQRAQQSIARAESYYDTAEEKDGNAFCRGRGDTAMANAAIFAAVAQAQQLKRIADAMEYSFGPNSKPSAMQEKAYEDDTDANESLADHLDTINRAREQMAGLRLKSIDE